jgi:hypothetical protein
MTNGSDAKRIARIVKNIESAQSALMDTRLEGNRIADHIACVLDRQLEIAAETARALQDAEEGEDVPAVSGRVTSF